MLLLLLLQLLRHGWDAWDARSERNRDLSWRERGKGRGRGERWIVQAEIECELLLLLSFKLSPSLVPLCVHVEVEQDGLGRRGRLGDDGELLLQLLPVRGDILSLLGPSGGRWWARDVGPRGGGALGKAAARQHRRRVARRRHRVVGDVLDMELQSQRLFRVSGWRIRLTI